MRNDAISLYRCVPDVMVELKFLASRGVSHAALQPPNVVEFDRKILMAVEQAHFPVAVAANEHEQTKTGPCWRVVDFGMACLGPEY